MAELADIGERTAAYVLAAQPPFDAMRASASQLAGYLLQRLLDPGEDIGDAPRLSAIGDVLTEAEEQLTVLAPGDLLAVHHHRHLALALTALRRAHRAALDHRIAARRAGLAEAVEPPLNQAIAQLHHAADALPGFSLVDLADCCGGRHVWGATPEH